MFFSGIPLLCVVVSGPVGITLAGGEVLSWLDTERGRSGILGSLALAVVITFLFHQCFTSRARQLEAERQATEARLRLRLRQGQIEPHFLFNTLAGVNSLIDHDPTRARQMLQDFTEYLRMSLGALRTGDAPLDQEPALAEHYLRLMAVRMDGRLNWRIEADAAARRVMVPPLLLQPLVENAVQHGLEPQLQGGTVTLSARLRDGRLVLEVSDDGRGPTPAPPAGRRPGSGLGLAYVRSRLQSRYDGRASLSLQPAAPGTCATLSVPLDARAIDNDAP